MPSARALVWLMVLAAVLMPLAAGALAWSMPERFHHFAMPLKEPLEQRFPPASLTGSRPVTGLVVLGGNSSRAKEGARLARQLTDARVIGSGMQPHEKKHLAGLPGGQVIFEDRSQNTYENATFAKTLTAPQNTERWLLVTSALHMPRAMGVFEAAGFVVEPWPVADDEWFSRPHIAAPRVVREIVGLIVYRLRGRTHSFFPRPASAGPANPRPAKPRPASPGASGV